jgi:hypothetical protein
MSGPQQEAKKHYEKQRRQGYHQANLTQGEDKEGIQVLQQLSQNKDLPIQPEDDEIIGQIVAEYASESNLSEAEIESMQWEREIHVLLWLCNQPTPDGLHGTRRGWAHGDSEKETEPITPQERAVVEAELTSGKGVLSLSKDGFGVKESARNVNESYVNEGAEGAGSSGGLLDKIGF